MAFPSARVSWLPSGVIVAAALALLVAMLWLPFGLNVGFTGDDWIYFHQIEQGSIMSQAAPTRLLWPIPYLLAYGLNAGHFSAFNIFLGLLFFCKGYLVYLLLRRLSASVHLAFGAAVLAILLPADTGMFYLGALSIQFVVVCYLLALYLLIVYWHRNSISLPLAIAIVQFGSVGMYELVYPLILFSPLVLLLFQHRVDFRFIRTALLWYVAPALYAIWYLWIILNFPRAFIYQSGLIERPAIPEVLLSLLNIYKRHFFDAWMENLARFTPAYWMLGLVAGAIVLGVSLWLHRKEHPSSAPRLTLLFTLGGLAIILLGVLLYLPTGVRDETFRTFYFSSLGAALTLVSIFWLVARRPLIFATLISVFTVLGMLQLLGQHQDHEEISERQQASLIRLAQVLPDVMSGSGIVIVDETSESSPQLNLSPLITEDVIPMLYSDNSLEGALCLPGDFGVTEEARCRFTVDGLVVPSVRTRYFVRPYAQLIFVRYDGAFSVVDDLTPYTGAPVAGYQPERLYDPAAPLPMRIAELFGN